MIYQPETLDKYRKEARELDYNVLNSYYAADIMRLVDVCNGVGGQGSKLNPILNFAYRRYQSCAAPHDWAYYIGGTDADKHMADVAFKSNMLIRWKKLYGAFRYINPVALWDRNLIRLAYIAVDTGGHSYFNYHTGIKSSCS
jgi:hypothetical protein